MAEAGPDGGLRVVDELSTFSRLAEGLERTGACSPDAIERLMSCLRAVARKAAAHGVEEIVGVGTSALRRATNADEILERARRELGIEITVVSGEREAALTFRGALAGLPGPSGDFTVLDVGAGSTELACGRGAELLAAASLELGSTRLFERHLRTCPARPSEIGALIADIDAALDASPVAPRGPLVALAGSACSAAALALGRPRHGPAEIHGLVVPTSASTALACRLAFSSLADRLALPGLPPERAPMLVAGTMILARVAARSGVESWQFSRGGVRWGLAEERLDPSGSRPEGSPPIASSTSPVS